MAQRSSLASSRASLEISSDALVDHASTALGANSRSVAYLVYANRGDPHNAGYKAPTTRDIPQMKLPRVESASSAEIADYVKTVRGSSKDLQPRETPAEAKDREVAPLNTVPEVFFNSSFQLNNPRTFDAVIGDGDSVVTQEKLSWYVDIVEAHLAQEIANASMQFFEATAQFTAIEDQARTTSKSVNDFADVVGAQQKVVLHYQETAELQRKLADANKLVESIDYLRSVSAQVDDLESAADAEVGTSLGKLEAVKALLRAKDSIDLRRLVAAQPLLERVEIAENSLKSKVRSRFGSVMISALRLAATQHASNGTPSVASKEYDELMADAAQLLEYSTELGAREECVKQYQLEIDREVKLVVRRNLPNSANNASQSSNPEESQLLARSLHALSADEAEKMCHDIFSQLTSLLAAIQQQHIPDVGRHLIEDVVSGADSRLARVLRVRKDPATVLSPPQFIRFFSQITEFCDFLESLSAVRATELREFLVAQTKLYVHCLHESLDSTLTVTMEADDWRRADVSATTQKYTNWLAASAMKDPPLEMDSLMSPMGSRESTPAAADLNANDDSTNGSGNTPSSSSSRLQIESQPFLISKSAVHLVRDLVSFLLLVCYLPPAQSILAGRASMEILQLFNHKTYAQIVGHGAIKTAGLRHINIRNLLLAHESLRMVETLLSPLRKCVERHSGVNGLTFLEDHSVRTSALEVAQTFDSVQQKYFDHRTEIHHRLVKLLSDKAVTAARQILDTDWGNPRTPNLNNAGSGSAIDKDDARSHVSSYMVELMRQTSLVARVAQEMLPASVAEDIISKTYASYKAKLLEAYSSLDIRTPLEKRNVLRDVNYFRTKSMLLKGAGNTADVIYETVSNFVAPEIDVNSLESSPPPETAPNQSIDESMDRTMDQTVFSEQPLDSENTQFPSILASLSNENIPMNKETDAASIANDNSDAASSPSTSPEEVHSVTNENTKAFEAVEVPSEEPNHDIPVEEQPQQENDLTGSELPNEVTEPGTSFASEPKVDSVENSASDKLLEEANTDNKDTADDKTTETEQEGDGEYTPRESLEISSNQSTSDEASDQSQKPSDDPATTESDSRPEQSKDASLNEPNGTSSESNKLEHPVADSNGKTSSAGSSDTDNSNNKENGFDQQNESDAVRGSPSQSNISDDVPAHADAIQDAVGTGDNEQTDTKDSGSEGVDKNTPNDESSKDPVADTKSSVNSNKTSLSKSQKKRQKKKKKSK